MYPIPKAYLMDWQIDANSLNMKRAGAYTFITTKFFYEGRSIMASKETSGNGKEVILTRGGYEKLEQELEHLRTVKRKEVAERIKTAISFGDISENSEYDDAKNEQAFIEGRVITLEKMLRNAKVIEKEHTDNQAVSIGNQVVLKDLEYDEVVEYTIVGSAESNPTDQKISNESPVGEAIIGKKVGEVVEVKVPAGLIEYEIVDIK